MTLFPRGRGARLLGSRGTRKAVVFVAALAGIVFAGANRGVVGQPASITLDEAFKAFWRARDAGAAADAARQILAVTTDFRVIYTRLKAGRPYVSGLIGDLSDRPLFFTPAGMTSTARKNARGLWHPYIFVVPHTYNPSKRYPVRFYLQGDTTRPASSAEAGVRWLNYDTLARDDSIIVFPGAWNGFPWWEANQVDHMAAILDELKRSYNVDENRVVMLGSSDGGTGIYYHAMLSTTPWAAFLPFNADPGVLGNPDTDVDAQLHVSNLVNKPLLLIQGGRDQIYPVTSLTAWLRLFESVGVSATLRVKDEYGHETGWWAQETPVIDAFIEAHPRKPLPDRVTWETADADYFNRAHWVIINELGVAADETAPDTPYKVTSTPPGLGVGIWREVAGRGVQMTMIQPGSVADAYGLRLGDIIERIDDVEMSTFRQVRESLQSGSGRVIKLQLLREGRRLIQPVGLPSAPEPATHAPFPHQKPSGRVDVERRGNTITVRTRGIRRLTLLLSPDQFDFAQPITIVVNGTKTFENAVTPSAAILLKWAGRDNDRTMLFGQEIELRLPAN